MAYILLLLTNRIKQEIKIIYTKFIILDLCEVLSVE